MFGYLQIYKEELKVREYEAYKSVYCGLCKQMGRDYSFLSRLSLSYDCTFYAMLLMSVARSCSGFKDGRCCFNPLKKCRFANAEDDCYKKAAAFSVISAYYKLRDDLLDSGFFRRLLTRIILPIFGLWHKKAAGLYPLIESAAERMMSAQALAESKPDCGADEAAHPTAQMLAVVFELEAKNESERLVYHEFGYQLGRWIYLIDAADDVEKDKKRGCFNPFSQNADSERIGSILSQSLARAYNAYSLINIKDFKGILDNMLLYGFPMKQNSVLYGGKKGDESENESI